MRTHLIALLALALAIGLSARPLPGQGSGPASKNPKIETTSADVIPVSHKYLCNLN